MCYNRLLKFQEAVEKVNEVKKEIQAAFQTRPRAKRLLRPPDEEETRENQSSPSNRLKASRALQFSSNNAPTTCTSSSYFSSASYSGSQLLLAGVNPMSYVRGVLSPIPQIGPNYRVFPHVETHQDFRPSLTSTPSCSSADPKENTQVRLSVQYPSKKLNRTLSGKTKLSLLRKTGKEDLAKFDLENVCKEWRERAPLFYSFLLTSAANKNTKSCLWLGSVSLAESVLLKQRNCEMSVTGEVMGVLLKSKAVEV